MIQDRKIVVVIPSGRERYMCVLMPYLLNPAVSGLVDRVDLWVNTDERADLEYFDSLEKKHFPLIRRVFDDKDLIKVCYDPSRNHFQYNGGVHKFYPYAIDPKTIYIKLDDDICYIHPDFFKNIVEYTIAHPECFSVLGNVVNIPKTSYLYQRMGLLTTAAGVCQDDPRDRYSCKSGEFAFEVHKMFMQLQAENRLEELYFKDYVHPRGLMTRIGVMAWAGETFAEFGGAVGAWDEKDICEGLPVKTGRSIHYCGNALTSHFAFSHHRAVLEDKTDMLDKYYKLALKLNQGIAVL
jgi:hypothetical protein